MVVQKPANLIIYNIYNKQLKHNNHGNKFIRTYGPNGTGTVKGLDGYQLEDMEEMPTNNTYTTLLRHTSLIP
jgi:hypothetical protein